MSGILSPEFWLFVSVTAGIYTIFALGLQVQYGLAGLLNFGHVAFMAIGAYTVAILVVRVGIAQPLAIVLALLAALPASLLLGLPTLRLRSDYLAMVTLAFAEIVRYLAVNETWLTGGPQGTISLGDAGTVASYNDWWQGVLGTVQGWLADLMGPVATRDMAMAVIVWSLVVILVVGSAAAAASPWGRVLRAIREDEDAAETLGKDTFWFKQQALAVGAVLGALAGVLHALQFSFFSPADFVPLVTFYGWMVLILGGAGRMWAVPLGAWIFSVLYAGTRFLTLWPLSAMQPEQRAYLRMVVIGLVLVALMRWRPQGMLGNRQEMVLE